MLANAKDISVDLVYEAGMPTSATLDPAAIRRVIDNLASNAIKYSARGSHITLQVAKIGDDLEISVKDRGQGIPDSEQGKLFTEFGRTSVQPTEGESSTGLGLAICKKFVEQHHGRIAAVSKPGVGSTFSFTIPAFAEPTDFH